jgi:CheY-like chemotaxis protein
MEIINEPFDFSSLINDTVSMVNVKACSAGIALVTNISKDIPPIVNGDGLRIKQALVNLFNNAVKFTKEGYISLSADCEFLEDGRLKMNFAVKDTGIGIKRKDINTLFKEYQRFDTHKNRHITGTGLGLSITRSFVELMGGHISVESEYGKGSTFSFYIICDGVHDGQLATLSQPERYHVLYYEPNRYHADSVKKIFADLGVHCALVNTESALIDKLEEETFTHVFFDKWAEPAVEHFAENSSAMFILVKEINDLGNAPYPVNTVVRPLYIVNLARILAGEAQLNADSKNMEIKLGAFKTVGVRVLLVDDHPANLIVAEGMLRQYGIDVTTVTGGREAVEAVKENDFDIVFMDHMMPDVDGIDATGMIRAMDEPRFTDLTIIALSANAVSGAKEQFLEAGMNDFLSKPIIINDLHWLLLEYIPHEKVRPN